MAVFDPDAFSEPRLCDFLQAIPPAARVKGDVLRRAGKVTRIASFGSVSVQGEVGELGDGRRSASVKLSGAGRYWGLSGVCSCGASTGCEHQAALAFTVLETVRLGGSAATGEPQAALAAWASAGLGRTLTPEEVGFLDQVQAQWVLRKREGGATGRALAELEMLPNHPHQPQKRLGEWRDGVPGVVDYWCCLALAAEVSRGRYPEFLSGITWGEPAHAKVRAWWLEVAGEYWRERLRATSAGPRTPAGGETELRLRFDDEEVFVEHRAAGAQKFAPLKPNKFVEFDDERGASLSGLSAVLWQPILERARYLRESHLRYEDRLASVLLGRLMQNPALRPSIVNAEGRPFRWEPEPLRWQTTESADGAECEIRLVQPDGAPAPRAVTRLPGSPQLLVTADAVWTLPPIHPEYLDAAVPTVIPAAALATPDGVRFLQRHAVPLPPSISGRVRQVILRPLVEAELRAGKWTPEPDRVEVQLFGVLPDGRRELRLYELAWGRSEAGPRRANTPQDAGDGSIEFVDSSALGPIPAGLEPAGFRFDPVSGGWTMKMGPRFPELFSDWLRTLPPGAIFELQGELASLLNGEVRGKVTVEITDAEIDWFDLKLAVTVSESGLTPDEVDVLMRARGKWVRLGAKGWRRLEFEVTPEDDARFARLGLNPHQRGGESQRLHALQLADDSARGLMGDEAHERIARRAGEIRTGFTPQPPAALKADLRPYQLAGFHFLCYLATNRFGGLLADDMGLGKTLQTLAWMAWLDEERAGSMEREPFLVVCPKSVADNWRAEAGRFTPHFKVVVWSGARLSEFPSNLAAADLHVINYAQLRTVGDRLAEARFHAVVLDEGQYIKNPSGQTAKLARGLRTSRRLVLTGTPIENRLMDLWSLMAFAMPGALGSRAEFERLYDAKSDPLARQRLAARVRPFLLRRTKAQVARDLPDRVEEDLYCEMEGEQRTLYQAELKRARAILLKIQTPEALNRERFNFLTSLLRLRQICCHPRLVMPESREGAAKVEALFDTLEPLVEEGHRVLVFSQFIGLLEILRDAVIERGWPHFYLTGDTEDRGRLVRDFQAHEGGGVFLISLKAGGAGLNLTAASYVVLFDPWWNPAVEAQAIDRTHRIGQTQKVIAYRLLIKDSIEEKIRALQRAKSQLAQDILGEENFAQGLTIEDLQFLFKD